MYLLGMLYLTFVCCILAIILLNIFEAVEIYFFGTISTGITIFNFFTIWVILNFFCRKILIGKENV